MNKYPLGIERDLIRLYRAEIQKFERRAIREVISAWKKYYERYIETDAADDPFLAIDDIIRGISEKYKIPIDRVNRIFASLDKWSYNTTLKKTRDANTPDYLQDINIIKTDGVLATMLKKYASRNAALIKEVIMDDGSAVNQAITKTVQETVAKLAKKSVSMGDSISTLSKNISAKTGVIKRKADFWARDQIGKAYGDMNSYRHEKAGFPGYIWMANLDNRVRDSHAERHGQYYTYADGGLKPGDDYNCRCDADPAFPGEELSVTERAAAQREIEKERKWAKKEKEIERREAAAAIKAKREKQKKRTA